MVVMVERAGGWRGKERMRGEKEEREKEGRKRRKKKKRKKKEREGEREDNIINPRVSLSSQDSNPGCGFRLLLISSSEKEQ